MDIPTKPIPTIRIKSSSLKKATGPIQILIQPEDDPPTRITKKQITKAVKDVVGAKAHPSVMKSLKKSQTTLHKRPVPRKASVTVKLVPTKVSN